MAPLRWRFWCLWGCFSPVTCASLGARGGTVATARCFLARFGILSVTGYGLYYAGGESLRAWTSWIHLAVGLALRLLLVVHIWLGKRTRPATHLQKRPPSVAKLT